MAKVHVVNHTHWDREWYFTTADSVVLSENSFTDVLDELEQNQEAKFCLDGQSSIVDEYLEVRPERLEQVIKFVKQKRLAIGPWYTQTDAFFVNAESIIRNLTLGIRDCKRYGGYMNIGYLPDSFGFNAQLPTIFKNCGIADAIFYRGINFEKQVSSPYFKWQGLSGKEVTTVNLIKGYGGAAFLEDSEIYVQQKLFPIAEKIKSMSKQAEIMIPVGEDQLDIVPALQDKLAGINKRTQDHYEISSYEEFFQYLHEQTNLESYQGEFREPCLARVHKSIGSVRYDIKRSNFLIEQKLLNRVEPLMAIARMQQLQISERLLQKAWKKLLETHAHDGMGGCVSDNVAVDIFHRMKEADEIADGIENMIIKRMAEKIGLKEHEVLVFNTLPVPFDGYKKIQIVASSKNIRITGHDEIQIIEAQYFEARERVRIVSFEGEKYVKEPAYYRLTLLVKVKMLSMGYQVLQFEENSKYEPQESQPAVAAHIENEYYTITFDKEGLELKTRSGQTIRHFIEFEDCANDGDTYDFSPLAGDRPRQLELSFGGIEKADITEKMHLAGQFELPYRLGDRLQAAETRILGIDLTMTLIKGIDRIELACTVDNQIYSHRLRAKIATGIMAKETIASLPFGYIRRPVNRQLPLNWEDHYVEIPIDLEPYDGTVAVAGSDYCVTALAKGMKEYQFQDESLYLTMFSSTSQLGKENLLYRPGRASGDTTRQGHMMIETPLAELIGKQEFEFALRVSDGHFDEVKTTQCWQDYTIEHPSYQIQTLNKFIYRLDNKIQPREHVIKAPAEFSLLQIDETAFFSSLSPSLYDDAVLLRLKNPTKKECLLTAFDFSKFARVEKVNDVEVLCENQQMVIGAYDTMTLKLWYE